MIAPGVYLGNCYFQYTVSPYLFINGHVAFLMGHQTSLILILLKIDLKINCKMFEVFGSDLQMKQTAPSVFESHDTLRLKPNESNQEKIARRVNLRLGLLPVICPRKFYFSNIYF